MLRDLKKSKGFVIVLSCVFCCFLGSFQKIYGQTHEIGQFYNSMNEARFRTFITKDSTVWNNFLKKASKKTQPNWKPLHYLGEIKPSEIVKNLYNQGLKREAKAFLKYAIQEGYHIEEIMYIRSDDRKFNEILNTKKFTKCLAQYDNYRKTYLNTIDLDFQLRLTELYACDQGIRNLSYDVLRKTEFEYSVLKYLDSINLQGLATLLVENGNSFFKKAGTNGSYFLVLWHTLKNCDSSLCGENLCYKTISDILKNAVMNGVYPNRQYAYLIDRANFLCDKPNVYGEYLKIVGGAYLDIETIDQRRAEIYLPPLWQDALIYNFELPDGYPLPEEAKKYFQKR